MNLDLNIKSKLNLNCCISEQASVFNLHLQKYLKII